MMNGHTIILLSHQLFIWDNVDKEESRSEHQSSFRTADGICQYRRYKSGELFGNKFKRRYKLCNVI